MGATEYIIRITERQAHVINSALELYFRVGMGQFEEIIQKCFFSECTAEQLDEARVHLKNAQVVLTKLPPNAYHSITSDKIGEWNRVACDFYDVIRNRLAWDRSPEGGWGVDFRNPSKFSSEPLATITKVTP